MKQTHKRGFTLIELLMVITIISVLSAILFPAFAIAREKARQTACLSNEKQMGLAFSLYAQDFDDTLPVGMTPGGSGGCWISGTVGLGWAGQIWPYTKTLGVFSCPSDTSDPGTRDRVSYAYNRDLADAPFNGNLGKFTAPSVTVQLFEVSKGSTYLGRAGANQYDNWNTCGMGEYVSPAANGGDIWGAGYIDYTYAQYETGNMGNPARTNTRANPLGRHTTGSNSCSRTAMRSGCVLRIFHRVKCRQLSIATRMPARAVWLRRQISWAKPPRTSLAPLVHYKSVRTRTSAAL